jgi:hypothetical protein
MSLKLMANPERAASKRSQIGMLRSMIGGANKLASDNASRIKLSASSNFFRAGMTLFYRRSNAAESDIIGARLHCKT